MICRLVKRIRQAPTDDDVTAGVLPRSRASVHHSVPEPGAAPSLTPARIDEILGTETMAQALLHDVQLALRDSEQQFRELIEQSSDGIFLADTRGNYLLANPRLCEMLGFSETQLLVSNVALSYPEMDGADFTLRLQRIQQQKQMSFARLVKRSDGSCFPAEISLRVLRNGLSQGIVRDVSVRDHEQRLLALEHSVARIFAGAEDPSAALVAVIRAVCEAENWHYGRYWRPDPASGRIKGTEHWCPPDPAIEKYLARDHHLARGEGLPGKVWESGEALWVGDITIDPRVSQANLAAETGMRSCFVFPIAAEGKLLGVFAFMGPHVREPDSRMLATAAVISSQAGQFLRRKNAEAALSFSEQFARSTLDSLPEHLCVINEEGMVLTVNRAWREFAALGGESSMRVGEGVNYLHACDRQDGVGTGHPGQLACGVRAVLSGAESTFSMEYSCRTPSEERWFLAEVSRFVGSGAVRVVVAHRDITARIRGDEAQRASEARFMVAFEHAPIGVALEALDGRFLRVNHALCQLLGYDEKELTGKTFQEITHADDLAADRQSIVDMLAGTIRHYHAEKRYFHKSGRLIWIQLSVSLIRDAQDRPEHFIAHVQDISEHRRIETEVKLQRQELRLLFDLLPAMIWFKDTHNNLVRVNRHAAASAEMSVAEMEGKSCAEVYPQHADMFFASDLEVIQSGTAKLGVVRAVRTPDGEVRIGRTDTVPYLDDKGRVTGVMVVTQDISEQVKAEEAWRHSEAMFRDIFNSSPVPLAVTDAQLRYVHLNPAFTETFGYTLQDIPTLQDWWPKAFPDDGYRHWVMSTWQDRVRRPDHGGAPIVPMEVRMRCKNGQERIVVVGAANLGDSAEGTTLVILYDVTERKRAEQAVREYATQQKLIADFGHKALANTDLDELLDELATLVAAGLNVEFCKVLQFGPDGHTLLHKAGVGWQDGWIGGQVPDSDRTTRTSFVLASREPLTVADYTAETRFAPSTTLALHNISSGIDVPILGSAGPLGVIGAYSRQPRHFTPENVSFLQNLANTVGTAMDRKALEERFAYLAQFDSLTGLPNRGLLLDRFAQTLTQAARNQWLVGILFVDLDRFKVVNDTRGHGVGDALLMQVAARLQECVRPGDTVGRLGGDEFAIVLCSLGKAADAGMVADKVVSALSRPFRLGGQDIYVSASLGIGIYPTDGMQADVLLRNADTAMYRAKERGRNTFQFYLPEMNERSAERLALETQLRGALERHEFLVHYQPKANIASGAISGFEALLRWQHPQRGLVQPEQFISILEDTGMIVPVGEWVLRTVCEQLNSWKAAGIAPRPVAVNLSARQFQQRNLDSVIAAILRDTQVDADLLELELTESMLMRDPEEAVHTLEALRAYGVALAVDDFGTGYSSLSYLQRFPLDALKIDRAFIRDITTKTDDASIAVAIITLAHSLKLKVIAEGVETEAQLNFLRIHGCDEMQGYFFSPALSVESCTRALTENRCLPPGMV
jgi:diguanylate cyclase (GGDEF)-like protein/PAS domain S-box-containing protein